MTGIDACYERLLRIIMPTLLTGGLITSTVSLLVVPAIFTYMDDFEGLVRRVKNRLRRHPKASEVPVEEKT